MAEYDRAESSAGKEIDYLEVLRGLFTIGAEKYRELVGRKTNLGNESSVLLEDLLVGLRAATQPDSFFEQGEPGYVLTPTDRVFRTINPDQTTFLVSNLGGRQISDDERNQIRRTDTTQTPQLTDHTNFINPKINEWKLFQKR